MGDIKRKKSKFKRPKQKFDKERIDEEKKVLAQYGLKNKKEIWKAEAEISKIRRMAKTLIPKSDEEQKEFFGRLNHMGLKVKDTADVLGLTKNDWLERRLQTIVFKKGYASTTRGARQLITHKHVLVDGKVVNKPGYVVGVDLEGKIEVKKQKVKVKKAEEPKEEVKQEEVKEDGKE